MPGFPFADRDPADDMPDEDACPCVTCQDDPRSAVERLKAALAHLETFPATDPLRQRIELRMATVKALRYRPVLFRNGTARD